MVKGGIKMSRIYKIKIDVITYNPSTMKRALDLMAELGIATVKYGEFEVYMYNNNWERVSGAQVRIGAVSVIVDMQSGTFYFRDYGLEAKEKIDQFYSVASFVTSLEEMGYQLSNIYMDQNGEIQVEMEEISL